jgi:hypothetical protein
MLNHDAEDPDQIHHLTISTALKGSGANSAVMATSWLLTCFEGQHAVDASARCAEDMRKVVQLLEHSPSSKPLGRALGNEILSRSTAEKPMSPIPAMKALSALYLWTLLSLPLSLGLRGAEAAQVGSSRSRSSITQQQAASPQPW